MLKRFLKYVDKHHLCEPEQKILLAVSGGADSMVMAELFIKSGFSAGFAHCNFGLRGSESEADELFVKKMANKCNCPIYIKHLDAREYAFNRRISIQMAARDMRYSWFEQLIQTTDYELYATAHHFDDEIETFFINLMRGTGIAGLTGIAPLKGHCIRPMLFADRKMIEDYANANGIDYRTDSSNQKDDYLRNRIRHYVLPAMEKASENFKTGMENTFNALQAAEVFVSDEMDKKRELMLEPIKDYDKIDIAGLQAEAHPGLVLYELLKPYGFNFSTVNSIVENRGTTPGKRFLSPSHELVIDRQYYIISPMLDDADEKVEITPGMDLLDKPVHMNIQTLPNCGQKIPASNDIAWLDYGKLSFPLRIRKYTRGDAFIPLGMKGRKKISDFLIDQKIPLPEKRNIRVLTSGAEIAWVIGHRIDERFKVDASTNKILALSLI